MIVLSKWWRGPSSFNNFLIYRQSFWHALHETNLYQAYPSAYFDHYLYGPLFTVLIAPFSLLPLLLGMIGWITLSMWVLHKGLSYFFPSKWPLVMFLIVFIEALTSVHNFQFNLLIAGGLLWAFGLMKEGKDWASSLLIVVLILTKIYGIVGLLLVFFTHSPKKFVFYTILWCFLGFILPMLISSPSFVVQSYLDWYGMIVHKNELNQSSFSGNMMQDISAMGFVKRVSNFHNLSTLYFLVPAGLLTILPLLRKKLYKVVQFQQDYYAQVLLGLVIFSSSSESSTYIIAISGFAIWIKGHYTTKHYLWLLLLTIVCTVLSPTDIFPPFIRKEFFVKYAIKAFPILIAWCYMTIQLLTKPYSSHEFQ